MVTKDHVWISILYRRCHQCHCWDHAIHLSLTSRLHHFKSILTLVSSFFTKVYHWYMFLESAPFIERYTDLWYGKRKTWVIIGQFLTGILLILISFFTQQDQARFFATMFIFIYFFISLQDIALDGLCLKQLRSPSLMSTIQAACQGTGGVLTSLILLKFTSK